MGHVASMVADLVAQEQAVTPTTIDDIFGIGSLIMKPFPTGALKQRVSSVTQANGIVTVDWSRGSGMDALAVGSSVTLPADLITNGQSLILTEATYDYDSPVDYLMPAVTQFSHRYYLRPRVVEKVACTTC
jgi:Flp pilus assembly protein TadG